MDSRKLEFFNREAQVCLVENMLDSMLCSRSANLKSREYNACVEQLKSVIRQVRTGYDTTVRANWESLKKER